MKKVFLATVIVMSVLVATAQNTDFSGTWKLKDQKSISGTLYGNGVPKQMKVTQTKDALAIDKTTANAQGEDVTTTEKLDFKGKPFETTTTSKRKKILTIQWAKDGKSFTEKADLHSLSDTSKIEITYTDVWKLEDGKLIFTRKAENLGNGEIWESKSVYEK